MARRLKQLLWQIHRRRLYDRLDDPATWENLDDIPDEELVGGYTSISSAS